jgi:hypothetical protein
MLGHAVGDTDALEVGVLGWVVGAAVRDTVGEVQAVALALGHAEGVREADPEVDTLPVPNKDPVIEAQPLGEGEPDTERVGGSVPVPQGVDVDELDTDSEELLVWQGVTLGEGVSDAVPHDVGDDDKEGEGVAEMLPDTLTDQLPVTVRLPLPLTEAVSKELWETL